MSKYNLTDIFEQYRIGSGYTRDFDYAGMLKAGLETGVDTDIEILRKMSDDFEDVNYHRENNHLQMAIDALEEGAIKEASMFFGDFHAEIKSTMETFDMEIPDTLGGFMDGYIKEDTKAVDLAIEASQEKAGINEMKYTLDSISQGDYGKNYDKLDPEQQKYVRSELEIAKGFPFSAGIDQDGARLPEFDIDLMKHMNEVRIDRDVANKIEGMLSIPLKAKFLDAFDDVWEDLTEDDMFYPEDVINHLNNEMHKRLSLYRTPDPKPEEIPMFKGTRDALDDISIREALPKFKGVPEKPSIIRALKVDGNGTKMEIDSYMASVKRSGDEFDDVDDYVEDFKNYIADKALQEHFGRFLKDYQ